MPNHHRMIIASYPAQIGFDVQITERNIHELYKLKGKTQARIVPSGKIQNKYEQAEIDLIFCLYREDPVGLKWLKGADKYIAVNINVVPFMHGLSPTALCYVEQPIRKETVTSLCDIVETSEIFCVNQRVVSKVLLLTTTLPNRHVWKPHKKTKNSIC